MVPLGLLFTVAVSVAVGGLLLGAFVRTYRQRKLGDALVLVDGEVVLHEPMALVMGTRWGVLPWVRTNGALVLSRDELVFVQWIPKATVRIRLSDLVSVETSASLGGDGPMQLDVRFRTDEGVDRVSFQVSELSAWTSVLQASVPAEEPLLRTQPLESASDSARASQSVSEG